MERGTPEDILWEQEFQMHTWPNGGQHEKHQISLWHGRFYLGLVYVNLLLIIKNV